MPAPRWSRGSASAIAVGVLLGGALAAHGCGGGGAVAARGACYPACLARLIQPCPLLSACYAHSGPDPNIPNPDVRDGLAQCFEAGERKWQAVNATSGDSYIVVKRADDGECYTVIAAAGATRYTILFGGQTVAELDAPSPGGPATVTCAGTTTDIVETPSCPWAPWTNVMTCQDLPCAFGVLPPGADAGMPNVR